MSSSSPLTADPEQTVQLVGYGGITENRKGDDTPDTASATTEDEETEVTHTLLADVHAKFSPKCLFEAEAWGKGTASVGNEILNLVKNIVGSGGLSLPAGIAAFGNKSSAIIPAIVLIFVMGLLNAYSFSLLGRVCNVTKSKTYQEAWDRTMGRRHGTKYNSWVGLIVTGKAILGCWSFSIVIASTCQPLLKSLGFHEVSKSETLICITVLILLPLCFLERLSSLAAFSLIGQLGTLVTSFTMILRYFDGSYREGGRFYEVRIDSRLFSSLRKRFHFMSYT
jgi:amino acid permease